MRRSSAAGVPAGLGARSGPALARQQMNMVSPFVRAWTWIWCPRFALELRSRLCARLGWATLLIAGIVLLSDSVSRLAIDPFGRARQLRLDPRSPEVSIARAAERRDLYGQRELIVDHFTRFPRDVRGCLVLILLDDGGWLAKDDGIWSELVQLQREEFWPTLFTAAVLGAALVEGPRGREDVLQVFQHIRSTPPMLATCGQASDVSTLIISLQVLKKESEEVQQQWLSVLLGARAKGIRGVDEALAWSYQKRKAIRWSETESIFTIGPE